MKKILIVLFLLLSIVGNATIYYVATNGSDSNPGTLAQPFASWQYGINKLSEPGDILYIRGGTYHSTYGNSSAAHLWISGLTGTSASNITISAYPGEVPIFDLSTITIPSGQGSCFIVMNSSCSYVTLRGLTITGMMQPNPGAGIAGVNIAGFYTTGSTHLTIDNCVAHDMGGYGFSCNNSTYVTYKNCDAHHCIDPYSYNSGVLAPYENANGFGVTGGGQLNSSDNITFDGCRSWQNADDGFDFYGVDAYITVNNCWSFKNAYKDDGTTMGNGQGFKLGPGYTGTSYNNTLRRVITNCIAAGNKYHGYDQNWGSGWGTCIMDFYNNVAYANAQMGWAFNYLSGIANVFKNNVALSNGAGTANVASAVNDHNTWNGSVVVTTGDFPAVTGIDIASLKGARQADGSLPVLPFMHLIAGSDLIHAGTNVGLTYDGNGVAYANPPSMGAYEYTTNTSTVPTVTTTAVTAITNTSASGGGNVTSDGGATVTARGVCWNTSANPTTANSKTANGTGTGVFTSSLTALILGTTYHVRAYATNSIGTAYGADVQFATTGSGNTVLTVCGQTLTSTYTTTHTATTTFTFCNNSLTTSNTSGYMLNAGDEGSGSDNNKLNGAVITGNKITWTGTATSASTHGIFVGYNINTDIRWNYISNAPYGVVEKSGNAGVGMTSTSGGVAYNVFRNCMIAVLVKGINGVNIYGNTIYQSFAPYPVSAGALIFIQENDGGGNAPSTGTKIKNNIFYTTQYGVININIVTTDCAVGFESDYNIYYCEGGGPLFAYNGSVLTFTQWQALGYDTHSIVINPNFVNTTDLNPSARLDYGTNLGTTWLTGLSTSSTWVVNQTPAKTDQNGLWQSGARIYTASVSVVAPTVTTTAVSGITVTSAQSGGTITSNGGGTITQAGICWSSTSNPPTIADSKTNDYYGSSPYISYFGLLTAGTTYRVRAYATNSAGTGYGATLTFTTPLTTHYRIKSGTSRVTSQGKRVTTDQ